MIILLNPVVTTTKLLLEISKWDDACNRSFKEWGGYSNFLNPRIKFTDNRPDEWFSLPL